MGAAIVVVIMAGVMPVAGQTRAPGEPGPGALDDLPDRLSGDLPGDVPDEGQNAASGTAGPTVPLPFAAVTGDHDPPLPPMPTAASDDMPAAGGVRVALVDTGVNYTLPSIADALARHPDGTLVGHDFHDLDDLPFDRMRLPGGRVIRHGTKTASVLIDEAPAARLVPYRYPAPDMTRMAALVDHAAAQDVRVVGLPLGGVKRGPWEAFERAARSHPDILFIASAGNDRRDIDREPIWPAAFVLENLVVVTSADDFGSLASGVNSGRTSVDYLMPSENVPVLQFDGSRGRASGSSYAVPKMVALAARLIADNPEWRAPALVAELRRRFADGSNPRVVGEGFVADSLAVGEWPARIVGERVIATPVSSESGAEEEAPDAVAGASPKSMDQSAAKSAGGVTVRVPLDVLVPNAAWAADRVDATVARARTILATCEVSLDPVRVRSVRAPERLADLSIGGARTLFEAVRESGSKRRVTVVLARDTQMLDAYDGEAFGRGNTRHRSWLTDSVWLTAATEDAGIALAHELFHVLADSGAHDPRPGNLMQARTRGDNTRLGPTQCASVRDVSLANGIAVEARP